MNRRECGQKEAFPERREEWPFSCDMESSEVFALRNDSFYESRRLLLLSLSLYEGSRIRAALPRDGEVLNSDGSGL